MKIIIPIVFVIFTFLPNNVTVNFWYISGESFGTPPVSLFTLRIVL